MKNYNYGIDQLRQSMVKIFKDDGKTISGSGFIIRSDGYLITCHHVIYQLNSLKVEYQEQIYDAQWCEELSNPEVDIAILKIDVRDAKAVPIVDFLQEVPTSVTVYGFPGEQPIKFPEGLDVSAQNIRPSAPISTIFTYRRRETSFTNPWNKLPKGESLFRSYRIDAKVERGTSGGPVFAEDLGGVVGVIQCSKSNESYVIRWDNIIKTLGKLGLEPGKNAVCRFLEEVENEFKHMKLFHSPQEIILEDQYIPIEVTLERKYRHEVETSWGYAESDEELKRAYALKGVDVESQPSQVPWEEAKKQHRRIMILADPGMGKSTLLKMEALSTAKSEKEKLSKNEKSVDDVIFPIALTLSQLDKEEKPILNAILVLTKQRYPETSKGIIYLLEEKLKKGNCLLLLDALDEVPKEHRNNLSEKLDIFARNYPCPIICTSRIVGYGGAFLTDAKEVEIVPFSQKQIEQYVKTWFKNAAGSINDDSVSADGLIRELRNKPQIRGLSQNPLLLSLLCSLYQEKELTLPARRCQVYEKAVDYMLSKWSQNRRPQSEGRIAKIRLLEELAYHFTCEGVEIFSSDDLFDGIEEYLQGERVPTDFRNSTTSDLIMELSEEDGILQLEKNGERYLFLHRTFQEYLTASYLNRTIQKNQNDGIALAREHFWEYDWHETLGLLAGLMKDPVPLLQAITDKQDDIFSSLLLLAGRCIAECEESSHPLITKIIDRIYWLWKSYPLVRFIRSTIAALGQANSQMSERLQKVLNDKDSSVRLGVAFVLGDIGSPKVVDALIQALKDEDSEVRMATTGALWRIGSRQAVEAIIQAPGNNKARDVILMYIGELELRNIILNLIGIPRAVNVLIQVCKNEESLVRKIIAQLGEISNPQAFDALIQAIKDEEGFVRSAAARALGKVGSPQAFDALIQALNDCNSEVRVNAALALGKMGSTRVVEYLIQALNHEDIVIRQDVSNTLSKISNPQVVEALIQALINEDSRVRSGAANALNQIGSSEAVEPLIQTLKDEDETVRFWAARALGNIGNTKAVEPLIQALNDKNSGVRGNVAEALEKIGTLETLAKLIQSPEIDIYDSDIFSLARTLAVRFNKEKTPFIPVYPELIRKRKT